MSKSETKADTRTDGKTERASYQLTRSMVRMSVYYGLLIATFGVLIWAFPWLTRAISRSQAGGVLSDAIVETFGGAPVTEALAVGGWEELAVEGISLLGALAIMIPVAWTYIIIKRRSGYDQSVVHTLIILPVAVTGIVMVVKMSLPLAFSLAGIVAAVRFRTTLEDTKDAVYVFLAIGVGLAAGDQRLGTALLASIVFNVVNLILWRMKFGNIYVDQLGRTSGLALGDVLAGPESGRTALAIGDQALLTAMPQTDLQEVADRVARVDRYLDAETDIHKEKKQYAILLVYTESAGEAQQVVERQLAEMAIRWRLAEIMPGKDEVSILEYLVRLKDHVPAGALLDAIRKEGGDHVRAAELRSLEGLKRRS